MGCSEGGGLSVFLASRARLTLKGPIPSCCCASATRRAQRCSWVGTGGSGQKVQMRGLASPSKEEGAGGDELNGAGWPLRRENFCFSDQVPWVQRGSKRGTDWKGQQPERVRMEQVDCGCARDDYSGAGRSSSTGARTTSTRGTRTNISVLSIIPFPWLSALGCCDDVTGFVERPARDGVDNPGALVVCLIVEDPFNMERFLASVDIHRVPNTDDRDRFGWLSFHAMMALVGWSFSLYVRGHILTALQTAAVPRQLLVPCLPWCFCTDSTSDSSTL